MKYDALETRSEKIEYYEDLLDFLDDHLPNLDELICLYEEEQHEG